MHLVDALSCKDLPDIQDLARFLQDNHPFSTRENLYCANYIEHSGRGRTVYN